MHVRKRKATWLQTKISYLKGHCMELKAVVVVLLFLASLLAQNVKGNNFTNTTYFNDIVNLLKQIETNISLSDNVFYSTYQYINLPQTNNQSFTYLNASINTQLFLKKLNYNQTANETGFFFFFYQN